MENTTTTADWSDLDGLDIVSQRDQMDQYD